MCGIAGALSFSGRPVDVGAVADLVTRMRHRGPNARGHWVSEDRACALGHARLSILDLSDAGHQPMVDPLTGNVIVFNGEIYDYRRRRAECEARGEVFHSETDTEVILALYRRFGTECVRYLRGMFAFGLWDAKLRRLVLVRDRLGKKPLNFALAGGQLIFSSELLPLAGHPEVDREEDAEARDLYFNVGYVPAPWTIYRGIRKLEPATVAVFDERGYRAERYWDIDYRPKIAIRVPEAVEAFGERLTEAVRLRMVADVPVGALLSGGVDSSVVVALMAKLQPGAVKTYSIGFREQSFNELPWADEAARIVGAEHHPRVVEGDVLALLPRVAAHYGEPYADSSALPAFVVCDEARRHVTVALNGDGGDELLGGYPRYWLSPRALAAARHLGRMVEPRLLARLPELLAGRRSIPVRLLRHLLLHYVRPELSSFMMYGSMWNCEGGGAWFDGAIPTAPVLWRLRWLAEAGSHADNPVDAMLWMDARTYLADDLLPKMDIASMQASLETRSPLLDHELIEFCAALPVHLKVRGGVGKYLLKRLAERWFSKDFVYRPKMGFGAPVARWLSGPLRTRFERSLRVLAASSSLSRSKVSAFRDRFFAHPEANAGAGWALLMYQEWRELGAG